MGFMHLPLASRLYIIFLGVAGAAATLFALSIPLTRDSDIVLAVFVAVAVATARMNVKIPFTHVHFSVDTAFVFAILMIYGLLPALMADAIGKFILSVGNIKKADSFKVPFNVASGTLSVYAAYLAYYAFNFGQSNQMVVFLLPVICMTIAYYIVNTGTVALAICITENLNPATFWVKNFLPTGLAFLTSGSVATLLFILDLNGGALGFMVTIPVIVLIYFSQKIYTQKEEEAISHIEELERHHLSTIQSLSLAIDAKDEYTHGHVHRVRSYALGLAKKMGIEDEEQLKGISFSSLVHDIGKIAIPDAILNKPGKYSEREFLRMQIHPVVGAEILKSIPLPFPVEKIVRAHHEKWNGRGYPDGLSSTEIPFESRIMAVADVYDAIRSNRPYRPKMEKARAIDIMKKEKGVSLDPDLVDVFLEHLDELEVEAEKEENKIQDIVRASYAGMDFGEEEEEEDDALNREAQRSLLLFNDLAHLLDSGLSLNEMFGRLTTSIGKVVPFSAVAVYLPDDDKLDLLPVFVEGKDDQNLKENTIRVNSGISGWVFTEGTPMVETPDHEEFSHIKPEAIEYKTALAFPLICLNRPIGVVTLYSELPKHFKGEDQDLLMKISPILGPIVKNLMEIEYSDDKDRTSFIDEGIIQPTI